MGALLDPIVDRLLVISGVVVVWANDLLPRWAIAVLVLREVLMLIGGQYALKRGVVLQINWLGRWGVWPTMSAIFFAIVDVHWLALACLYVGLLLAYGATIQYARDARAQLAEAGSRAPSSSG